MKATKAHCNSLSRSSPALRDKRTQENLNLRSPISDLKSQISNLKSPISQVQISTLVHDLNLDNADQTSSSSVNSKLTESCDRGARLAASNFREKSFAISHWGCLQRAHRARPHACKSVRPCRALRGACVGFCWSATRALDLCASCSCSCSRIDILRTYIHSVQTHAHMYVR